MCAHDLLLAKATDNIEARSEGVGESKAKSEPSGLKFEFRKSASTKVRIHQHCMFDALK